MKRLLPALLGSLLFIQAKAQLTPFEKSSDKNYTATYNEIIAYYKSLAPKYSQMKLLNYGTTDVGKPLTLVVLSKEKVFDPVLIKKQNKKECVNPRCANKPEEVFIQKEVIKSISGILCARAPHNIAFLPNGLPKNASPMQAPSAI